MKITTKSFVVLFTTLFLTANFANLSNARATNIAVVDIENVLKNSDAMKDAQKKIGAKQASFQKEIDKLQESLEKESKKIAAKKGALSEEGFNKEQEKFSKKVDSLKELVTSRQDSLKKSSLDIITKVNSKIKEVVEEIKEEKNFDIIINSQSAIYYQDDLDVSEDVLKRLNKKLSKVDVK
jgi:outer membrane protein